MTPLQKALQEHRDINGLTMAQKAHLEEHSTVMICDITRVFKIQEILYRLRDLIMRALLYCAENAPEPLASECRAAHAELTKEGL